jgi:MFS family permease
VGQGSSASYLAARPLSRRVGRTSCFLGVAIFGAATVGFGLSRSVWLSLILLVVMGGSDMLSVFVRLTLVQISPPPEMRGRVNAVNMLFIGASNELGEFESGLTAHGSTGPGSGGRRSGDAAGRPGLDPTLSRAT